MNRTQRIVVVCGLAAALAAGVGVRGLDRAAAASGPAAQAASEHDTAVINIYEVTRLGLVTPERRAQLEQIVEDVRAELRDKLQAQVVPLQTEFQTLQQELESMNPQDPQFREKVARWQQIQQEGTQIQQRIQQEAGQAQSERSAEVTLEVYLEVLAEARRMATERGYAYLLASADPEELESSGGSAILVQEMLARPALMAPEGADLTDAVRESLGYPEEAPEGVTPIVPEEPVIEGEPLDAGGDGAGGGGEAGGGGGG